ncbi:MAG TPA: hypothetical protein VF466_05040, partial [Candidatus Saccharimonadales bacterium]
KRHPGVLSTMTMGVAPGVFDLLGGGSPLDWSEGIEPVRDQPPFGIGMEEHGLRAPAFVLENLLARKVGLAEALVDRRFHGEARLVGRALDNVPDPQGTRETQWTAMLTYAMDLSAGAEEVPLKTASYDPLVWVDASGVAEAMRRHDALLLNDRLNPFQVCIGGLCVRSAGALLE